MNDNIDSDIDEDVTESFDEDAERLPVKPPSIAQKLVAFYSRNFVLLCCIKLVALGMIIRVIISRSTLGQIDESQSLTLLMNRDLMHGRFSTFRYGQHFGGTLENVIGGPITFICGMTRTSIFVTSIVFLFATSALLWRAFFRTPYKDTMRIVMACMWIWPGFFLFTSSRATGIFAVGILLEVTLLASAYFAAHSLRNVRYFYLWAFVAGLALWTTPLSLMVSIPCFIWVTKSARLLKTKRLRAAGLFILGSLPWWIFSAFHQFSTVTDAYEKHVGQIVNDSSHPLDIVGRTFGIRTFSQGDWTTSQFGVVANIIFVVALLSLAVLFVLGILRISKEKYTDFAYLQIFIIGAHVVTAIACVIISQDIDSRFFIFAIIPVIFVIVHAHDSRVVLIIALTAMFVASIFSLAGASRDHTNNVDSTVSQTVAVLKKYDATNVLAPHSLAYSIAVRSKNKITTTSYDANNFDSVRDKKVKKNVHAIVVDINKKNQTDITLCIQAQFETAFTRIATPDTDVYFVKKQYRDEVWSALKECQELSVYVTSSK